MNNERLTMYKNNSGLITITKISRYKKGQNLFEKRSTYISIIHKPLTNDKIL
jgi:hypothetical protein